jgi:hypothetical protein
MHKQYRDKKFEITHTTRSSFETSPKSCWVFLRSKKLKVNPPYNVHSEKSKR